MNGLANVLYLPLCPVSQEKLPAEEDWHEYGIDLSRSLKTLSEWIEDQIQSLTPKIAILAQSYPKEQEENVNKKKQPNKWSTLQEASHVLVPMGDLTWWSKTLENLSPLVESSKKPKAPKPVTLRTSTFDHNNQFFGQDPEEVTTIPAPESDLITRLLYGHQTRMAPKSTKAPVHEISESEEDSESTPFKLILRPLQAVRGPESVLNLTLLHHLLHMINLYYLDCVAIGGSKWTSVWTHSDQKSRMSFQSMVFLEIMHLRILRQIYCELYIPPETEEEPTNRFVVSSKYKFTKPPTDQQLYHEKHDPDMTTPFRFSECGAAYRQLCLTSKQFPWIFEKRLALERYIPVAAYTQSELEQTLTNLFFKFVRIEWHHELHHAINVIMDRLAVLFYNAQTEQVMNIEGLRTPISIETQEQIHQLQGSSNAPSTRQVLYSYNYDFLYRCSWRYYYAIQNILGFEQLIREPIPLFVPSIPKQELLYPSNLVQMQLYTRKQVTDLAAHIKQWLVGQFGTYSVGEYNTINEQIRRQVLDTVVPQGDTEWVKFKYPIIALNPNNIMEKIHSKFYMAIKQEVLICTCKMSPSRLVHACSLFLPSLSKEDATLKFLPVGVPIGKL